MAIRQLMCASFTSVCFGTHDCVVFSYAGISHVLVRASIVLAKHRGKEGWARNAQNRPQKKRDQKKQKHDEKRPRTQTSLGHAIERR